MKKDNKSNLIYDVEKDNSFAQTAIEQLAEQLKRLDLAVFDLEERVRTIEKHLEKETRKKKLRKWVENDRIVRVDARGGDGV